MRKDRTAGAVKRGTHNLASAEPGVNRFVPGTYRCQCGAGFSGLKLFERHRSDARRREREAA